MHIDIVVYHIHNVVHVDREAALDRLAPVPMTDILEQFDDEFRKLVQSEQVAVSPG